MILSTLSTTISFLKIIDLERRRIMIEFLGPMLGQFDYSMDIIILILSLALIFGYGNEQKWAFKGTFVYYGVYLLGSIIGVIIGALNIDKTIAVSSILKYGEIRPLPFPSEVIIYIGIVTIIIQAVIILFILKSVYQNKEYFKN